MDGVIIISNFIQGEKENRLYPDVVSVEFFGPQNPHLPLLTFHSILSLRAVVANCLEYDGGRFGFSVKGRSSFPQFRVILLHCSYRS